MAPRKQPDHEALRARIEQTGTAWNEADIAFSDALEHLLAVAERRNRALDDYMKARDAARDVLPEGEAIAATGGQPWDTVLLNAEIQGRTPRGGYYKYGATVEEELDEGLTFGDEILDEDLDDTAYGPR